MLIIFPLVVTGSTKNLNMTNGKMVLFLSINLRADYFSTGTTQRTARIESTALKIAKEAGVNAFASSRKCKYQSKVGAREVLRICRNVKMQ